MDRCPEYKELSEKLLGENASDEEINRICSVLSTWQKQISEDAFPIFKYIVSIFNYYSSEKAATVFKDLDVRLQYLSKDEILFLPLRTKDRMESSIPLVSMLQLHLSMNISRTNFKDSGSVLRDIYCKKREYAIAYRLSEKGMTDSPLDCSLTRSIMTCDRAIDALKKQQIELEEYKNNLISKLQAGEPIPKGTNIKKISADIRNVKDKIKKKESEKSGILNVYLLDYVSLIQVKNVVIFDDFLCTGTSVNNFINDNVKYLKELSDVQFLFLFLESTSTGKMEVEKTIKMNELFNVRIAFGMEAINVDNEVKKKSQSDLKIFQQEEERIENLFVLEKSKYQCRTAIATFINSPNSNCNFLCGRGNGEWQPLFERKIHPKININHEIINDTIKNYGN